MKIENKDIERMETAKIIIAKMETNKVYSSHMIQNIFKLNTEEEEFKMPFINGERRSTNAITAILKTAEKYGLIKNIGYITEKRPNFSEFHKTKPYAALGFIKI